MGNLGRFTTKFAVEVAFLPFEYEEIQLITDKKTGFSRGCAIVTFTTKQNKLSALEMNGKLLNGHNLIVNECEMKNKS